jgi:hypothetical protein
MSEGVVYELFSGQKAGILGFRLSPKTVNCELPTVNSPLLFSCLPQLAGQELTRKLFY